MEGEEFEKSFQWQDVFWVCFLNQSPNIELNTVTFFLDNGKLEIYHCLGLFVFPINVLCLL